MPRYRYVQDVLHRVQDRVFTVCNHLFTVLLLWMLLLLAPDCAMALQVHGAPEGLYVHQMAHLHFIFALGYLLWDIRRTSFTGKGWRYLQLFCILMLLWNIMAFVGHIAGVYLDPNDVQRVSGYLSGTLMGPFNQLKIIYIFTKLDHLFLVPALFFLFLGMRSFYKNSKKGYKGSSS